MKTVREQRDAGNDKRRRGEDIGELARLFEMS
jgi:hypothetical protein